MADLIDRTRLTQEITKALFSDHLCCPPEEAAHTLAKLIDDAPAVDAAPVVRAVWCRYKQIQMCSECRRSVERRKGYRYCPHCGAMMDEEV